MRYELIDCGEVSQSTIEDFLAEFETNGEFCNALWKAHKLGVPEMLKDIKLTDASERHEDVLAFFVGDMMVGAARVTPHPNHFENGNIGYYIRPSCRGHRYGSVLLHLIEDYCKEKNISSIVAMVELGNRASEKSFMYAGWKFTGRVYDWEHRSSPRKALEFCPKHLEKPHERW